jgi:hypothetical protein
VAGLHTSYVLPDAEPTRSPPINIGTILVAEVKRADAAIVASVLAIGLVASVALGAIATVWGRTPAGNTALVVPFAGGPALVAGGWTALILGLDQRQEASRGRLVVGALLGGALALVAALVAVFASLPVEAIVALVLGLVLARELRGRPGPGALVAGVVVALVATGLTLLPTGLGFFLAPLVVPFVVVTPPLAAPGAVPRWSWLAPAALAHLVLVIVGLVFLGSRLVG